MPSDGACDTSPGGICIDDEGNYIPNEKDDADADFVLKSTGTVFATITTAYFAPIAIARAGQGLWWTQRQAWKAGAWLSGEVLPAGAAYLLTKLGLDSKLSPYLVRYITNAGTHNSGSSNFVIGSYDAYIKTGDKFGYSYYGIPEKTYNILRNAGNDFALAPNKQFIFNMVNANKSLFIDQAMGTRIGDGLRFELQLLIDYWK